MTETPRPRRSTRAASTRAGSATPAPSVTSRRTRARTPKAAPLPAVPTATSHAYGASGKVSLDRQINLSGGEGGFADAFDANRGVAIDRDVEDEEPIVETSVPPPRKGSAASPPTFTATTKKSHISVNGAALVKTNSLNNKPLEEEEEEEAEEGGIESDDEDEKSGDEILTQGSEADYSGIELKDFDEHENADPYKTTLPVPKTHTKPKGSAYLNLTDLNTTFSYTESIAARTQPYRTVSLEPPPTRDELEAARPWSVAVLWETLLRWIQVLLEPFTGLSSTVKNLGLLGLILSVLLASFWPATESHLTDNGVNFLQKAGGLISRPFQYLASANSRRVIYDSTLVGRLESLELDVRQIKKEIRSSAVQLEQILPEQLMVQKNTGTGEWELPPNFWHALREKLADEGSSIAWDGFIAANRAKLDQAAQSSVQKAASKHSHVINQDMFIERVEQIAGEVASKTTTDMIKALPAGDKGAKILYNLALTNIARNTELAIQTVNYFSYGIGAVVNPYLTSPTHQKQKLNAFASIVKRLTYDGPREHPPAKALMRWEEATDCWCAAESTEKGKAQLGVIMPLQVVPTSITIEHIPARGTLDIGSAPKDFEVWVTNTEAASLLSATKPPRDLGLSCGEQPASGFVCVGKGRYDIHAPNHIQNFAMDAAGVVGPVNKVVLKVMNNWGKSYTCLYRVRFHGDLQISED